MLYLLLAAALSIPQDEAQPAPWNVDEAHGPTTLYEAELTEGTWISIDVSPDGEHVVFDLLGHLYEMPSAGGEARSLTSGRSWNMLPRYSPDGTRIAFTSDRGGSNDLWILERASGELENVSDMELPVFQGTWSLDGRRLYGTALDMRVRFPVYAFELVGGKQELIPAGDRAPVNHLWERPGEEAIYFVHNDASLPASGPRIKRFDTRTGEIETTVDRPGGAAALSLSPDGRRLAYVHRDDLATVLVVRDFATDTDRVAARGLDQGRHESRSFYGAYPNTTWHPNGREVLVSWGGKIRAVDVDSGTSREIPFRARAVREMDETMRFPVEVPAETARTRSHRWSQPCAGGILYEALGDLWLLRNGERRNLTSSPDHETSPLWDPKRRTLYFASWNDDELGSVRSMVLDEGGTPQVSGRLTSLPSQYGSLALSPAGDALAFLAGDEAIRTGTRLESQTGFELRLVTGLPGRPAERLVTEVTWTPNRYGKRPPTIRFSPDGQWLFFTEYEDDALRLRRIHVDGRGEETLYTFPHATRAVLSPDLRWIAFREYHRTFVTPNCFLGKELTVSAADEKGFAQRVDRDGDGDFTEWNAASDGLTWTRGRFHCEKSLAAILAGEDGVATTDLSFEFPVARPEGTLALTGVRVLTMDPERSVLENATILVSKGLIEAVGTEVEVPGYAEVIRFDGHTVMPGMFDAHGHYGSPISALNVIEQRLYGLHANLAYGVTTMYDVYGTTQKDFWVDDMLRAGRMDGPRIWSVGDTIFVTKYRTKMHRPITSLDDAREAARFNADHGARALKDYSNHRRAARQQLAVACREQGLNLVSESFADPQMNLTQLVDGFTGLEHTLGLEPLYEDVLGLFAATKVGMTPTLIVVYNGPSGEDYFTMRERIWEDPKLLHFFNAEDLIGHRRPTHLFDDDVYHARMARALTKLYRRGVLLQMGAHGQLMGLGAHWEVEMFVHGGFTPAEALEIATINGFTHQGLDAQLGSIEPGKLADLVVLRENPLDDIRNTRSVEAVMRNGFLYSGEDAARIWPDPRLARPMYSRLPR